MEPKAPVQTAIPDECVINSMIEKHGEVGLSLLPVGSLAFHSFTCFCSCTKIQVQALALDLGVQAVWKNRS